MDESHPADSGARIDLVGRYAAVFRSRRTLGYAAINAMGSGALFSFIGTSSLVLMGQMGLSAQAFGLTFALTSSGILTGSMLNNFLARRGVGARTPIMVGLLLAPVAAAVSSSFLIAGFATAWTYVPFIMLGGFSRGLITSNATFAALEPVPAHAGAAAALLGCSQTACAGLAGMLVAALFPAFGALAVTASMFLFTMASLFAWLWVEAKHPARPHG